MSASVIARGAAALAKSPTVRNAAGNLIRKAVSVTRGGKTFTQQRLVKPDYAKGAAAAKPTAPPSAAPPAAPAKRIPPSNGAKHRNPVDGRLQMQPPTVGQKVHATGKRAVKAVKAAAKEPLVQAMAGAAAAGGTAAAAYGTMQRHKRAKAGK